MYGSDQKYASILSTAVRVSLSGRSAVPLQTIDQVLSGFIRYLRENV
jgi:hypothetical protein